MTILPTCRRRDEDTAAIRVSNLSENVQDNDLQELFRPFGHIARIFLANISLSGFVPFKFIQKIIVSALLLVHCAV